MPDQKCFPRLLLFYKEPHVLAFLHIVCRQSLQRAEEPGPGRRNLSTTELMSSSKNQPLREKHATELAFVAASALDSQPTEKSDDEPVALHADLPVIP